MRPVIQWIAYVWIPVAIFFVAEVHAEENLVVRALPSVSIEAGQPIPITVSVGGIAASGVKVAYVSLVERQYKYVIAPQGFRLCKSSSSACAEESLSLDANRSHSLWLWGASNEGVYDGAVAISSSDKPAGGPSAAMVVYVSSWVAKSRGILLIATSVIVAFLFNVVFRTLLNRKQLLLPVASLKESLSAVRSSVSKLPQTIIELCSATVAQIGVIENSLQVDLLEQAGLPGKLPSFSPSSNLETYKAYVAAKSQSTHILNIVVNDGLRTVGEFSSASPSVSKATLKMAVDTIETAARYRDNLPPSEDAVRQAIATVLQLLAGAAGSKSLLSIGGKIERTEQLRLEIGVLNFASWLFILLITTFLGALALVLVGDSSLSFGTTSDYAKCVLWGLGLPAGTQLANATSANVSTTFGVPK